MRRRRLSLILAFALSVLVGTISTLQITSVWAAADLPSHPSRAGHAKTARPDIFLPPTANRTPIGQPGGPTVDKTSGGAREAVGLRTRTSLTLVSRGGYQLITYPGSIHFQDASGNWQNIDNTLVASRQAGYAFQNRANSYTAHFPSSLSTRPVEFVFGTASVSFGLVGAQGAIAASGSTATYPDALPGVSVSYQALNDQLKESLTLSSAKAPSVAYQVTTKGVSAVAVGNGEIDFVDRSGKVLFAFAPPSMIDAAGVTSASIQVQLIGSGSFQTLVMTPDTKWLADPSRKFPVVIDPTVTISYSGSSIVKTYSGANQDCYLVSSSPTTSFCGAKNLYAGYTGSAVDRTLLQFNVSIPQDANILEADLALDVTKASSPSSTSVSLYPVSSSWTTAASWNKRDGTNAWNTAGGDYSMPAAWTNLSVGPTTGWYHWYLSSVVQGWINGSATNQGLILKADNESTTNQLTFYSSEGSQSSNWPYLKVIYQLGIGDLGWYRNVSEKLTDQLTLKENLSSGNMLGVLQLVDIKGTGLNEIFNLNYNILSPNLWDFGRAWITNTGWDQYVDPNMGDGASFFGPTGYAFHYIQKSDGTYTTPPGIDADLIHNGDGTWTISYHSSGEKLNFTTNGLYMTSDVDGNGDTISFAYNASGSLASITDTQGRVTAFSYVNGAYTGCAPPTSSGFVSKITDPSGRTYQFTYDTNCDLTTYTDPNSKVVTFTYDSLFNLIKVTDAVGNQTNLTYSTIYKVTSVTRVTSVSQGTGPTTSFTYNTGNTVVTDPNNNQSTFVYDTRDRVTQTTNASGSTSTTYTNDNKHATDTDQLNNQSTYTYNSNNVITQATAPVLGAGHTPPSFTAVYNTPASVSGYQYRPSSVVDPEGNCTAYLYDSAGRVTDVYSGQASPCDGLTGGIHTTTRYQGDPGISCGAKAGQVCSSINGNGATTAFAYDSNGNVVTVTPPSPLGATTFTYDSLSRTSTVTDGKGQKTTYNYDAVDRVTQVLFNGATTCTPGNGNCITYAFDGDGNRTSMVDQSGTTSYFYDALNRLTTESLPDISSACSGSSPAGIAMTYDAAGNMLTICDSGGTNSYTYNQNNRLVSIAEPGGSCGTPPSLCTTFGYNAVGNPTSITFPGGATQTTTYDNDQNIASITGKSSTGTSLTSFAYTYVHGANDTPVLQTATESDPAASNTYTYAYDSLNRLTGASVTSGSGTSYSFTYDSNGNMLTRTAGSASTTMAYNAADEICWLYSGSSSNSCASPPNGATTYNFDSDGNETASSSSGSFTYNAKNQTTSITYGGTTLGSIAYSDTGQALRISAGTTTFNNETAGVGIATSGGASTFFLRDNQGSLIGERIGTQHYYYLTDRLGSVVAVISGDGQTVSDRRGYDPYGNTTLSTGTVPNPFWYIGGYVDPTGLIKFGARYYDPSTARWTQTDPAHQGSNGYSYVGDDPVNNLDPAGLWWIGWYWWGVIVHLNGDETDAVMWFMTIAAAFWGFWAAALGVVAFFGVWIAGLVGVILALVAAAFGWNAAVFGFLNWYDNHTGTWVAIGWWTIWNWGGGAWAGCSWCWWGLPIWIP